MKLFKKMKDGGPESPVDGYFLIEWKGLFSIALLHFNPGMREAYHSHAFNALTFWLKGNVVEHRLYPGIEEESTPYKAGQFKVTKRDNLHRIEAPGDAWALSFRGPWAKTWMEYKDGKRITLTHGREVVSDS